MSKRFSFFMDEENLSNEQKKNTSPKGEINDDINLAGVPNIVDSDDLKESSRDMINNPVHTSEATYRCEQINITKIDGIAVSNSKQKFQFHVKLNLIDNTAHILLEDHYYNVTPPVLNKIFDFITQIEFIRNNLHFKIDEEGRLNKILNQSEQAQNWLQLKTSHKFETEFIRTLEVTNPHALKSLIEEGDIQFSENRHTEEEYRRNLLIWILFDRHLYKNTASILPETFLFQSHLVPPLTIPLNVKEEIIIQDNEKSVWRKAYTANLTDSLIADVKAGYDTMHKQKLHYNFTSYDLNIYITKEVDKKTKFVDVAKLRITEEIENNLESYCEYSIRRLP